MSTQVTVCQSGEVGAGVGAAVGPITITNGNANVREIYYIPCAFNASDLRGAIYAAVTNATMNLHLTLPANPTVASTGDPLNAAYIGTSTAGSWNGNVTITVYQVYYDQLPTVTQNGVTTVALPTAYSSTRSQPMIQAKSSPRVA